MIAGVDEAGRGALAGPLVAAAVILKHPIDGLMDSKALSASKRLILYESIMSHAHVRIGIASRHIIDRVNVLQATLKAMRRAIIQLPYQPTQVIIDGNRKPSLNHDNVQCLVRADQMIPEVSAASIVAKVIRDRIMVTLDQQDPRFKFAKHKGYGTKEHYQYLQQYGPSPFHRQTFNLKLYSIV